MNRHAIIPPLTNEDRLPHEKAVWRPYLGSGWPAKGTGQLVVSIDYGSGQIVQGYADELTWHGVQRWRYGWAPA